MRLSMSLLLVFALPLAACQAGGAPRSVQIPGDHLLKPGAALTLPDGGQLRYLRVVQDSRCPPKMQCIRAGDADIELEWRAAGGTAQRIELTTNAAANDGRQNSVQLGVWRLRLAALGWQTPPQATLRIERATD